MHINNLTFSNDKHLSNPLSVKKNQIYIYYSKIVFKIIINKTEKIFPLLVDLRFSQEHFRLLKC